MTEDNWRTRSSRRLRHWLPFLLLILLGILAAQPLLSLQFFHSDDGLDHLLRLFALDDTIRQGVVYPRWLFDLAYGYGYPLFDFYPPLAAHIAETLHLLGLGFVDAIKGTDLISIVVALTGAYILAVELFRDAKDAQTAGILTAVAYVFFPYFLIDIYTRSAIAEALAAALLPWLVWSLRRGLREPSISSAISTAVFAALLLLAHSLTLFIAVPVLIAYALFEVLALPATTRRAVAARITLSALLGVGLGAFYWLPFVTELNLVKMGKGIGLIAEVFSDHFLALSALIQSSLLYQYSDAPFALGLTSVVVGILAIAVSVFASQKLIERRIVLFFGAVSILATAAMIEPLRDMWLALPFVTMVQYPWRVSVLIGLGLSMVIGALPIALARAGWLQALSARLPEFARSSPDLLNLGLAAAVAGALVWSAIANLAPQQIFFPSNAPTLAQLARFEAYSGFIATTTWGEYLPATVNVSDLLTYRAPPVQSSANVGSVQLERWTRAVRVFRVSALQPVSLSLRSFYFAGWEATVDGAPVTTFANTPLGLLTMTVPAGEHRIAFKLKDTLPQQAGTIISILSVLVFAGLAIIALRRGEKGARRAAGVFVLGLVAFLIPASAAVTAQPEPVEQKQITVSPQLDLIGLTIDGARLQAGVWHIPDSRDSLTVQTYWFTKNPADEKPFAWRLLDSARSVSSQSEQSSRYGTGNVAAWIPNEIVDDQFDLPLDPGLSPGSYTLQVAFGGSFVTVGSVDLERGSAPAPAVNIPHKVDAHIGSQIELVGYAAPQTAQPGTPFPLTLYWQAEQSVTTDYTVFVQLWDVDGNVAARPQYDTIPGGGLDPTSLWLPGALIADRQDFDLSRDLEPGLYHLVAGMYHYPNLTRLPVMTPNGAAPDDVAALGDVKVPMNAQNANPSHALDVSLGSAIRLNGYDLQIQPQQIAVRLYWQARAKIDQDYKVFVHISDAQGNVVAQQDSLPDAGHYPTRIWDAGEQVLDAYQIPAAALPEGQYTIFVGMYSPETGERLRALDQNGNNLPDRQIEIARFDLPG
jgi:6-pyruvoyl-tetrahydropterin synthase related domain